jgi:hypothetical protein
MVIAEAWAAKPAAMRSGSWEIESTIRKKKHEEFWEIMHR